MRSPLRAIILGAASVAAFNYHVKHKTSGDNGQGFTQSAFVLSEGGMYASHKGPFGSSGPSLIQVNFTTLGLTADLREIEAGAVNVHIAFVDSTTKGAAGVTVVEDGEDGASGAISTRYCCTSQLLADGLCGPGIALGGFIVNPDVASRANIKDGAELFHVETITTTAPSEGPMAGTLTLGGGGGIYEVLREGPNYVIVAACDAAGATTASLPALDLDIDVSFRNPYGYLPGQVYGYLPFYSSLLVGYSLLALFFLFCLVKHRQYILSLQWLILGVILMGTLEMAVWTGTYSSKNESGIPTPCNVCPTTSDYMTAVVLNVAKRAISRVLLLAVTLGFGVVHPSLDKRTTFALMVMGAAYFGFGVLDDVSRETAYDATGPSAWELPILVLDLLFVLGIYGGLNKTRRDLSTSGQAAKLQMYTRLLGVLLANVAAWFAITLVLVAIRLKAIPVPWQSLFFLVNFWDALYLCVLLAVAWIWLPGPSAFNYAWYSQGASNEAEAEADEAADGDFDENGGVEMVGGGSRKNGNSNNNNNNNGGNGRFSDDSGIPPDDAFAIGQDAEDDDDFEEDGTTMQVQHAPRSTGKASSSAATSSSTPVSTRQQQQQQTPKSGATQNGNAAFASGSKSSSAARTTEQKRGLTAAASSSLDVNDDDIALDLEDDDDDFNVSGSGGAGGAVPGSTTDDLDLDLDDDDDFKVDFAPTTTAGKTAPKTTTTGTTTGTSAPSSATKQAPKGSAGPKSAKGKGAGKR